MRVAAIVATLIALSVLPACAQTSNPAGKTAGTPESEPGKPAAHQPNAQDRLFYLLAGAGGAAEVESARTAEKKANDTAVREFARRMAQDHGKANRQLTQLAKAARVAMPDGPDPEQKAKRAELDRLSGKAFDVAYMQQQLVEHQKAATLLQWQMSAGQDPELQRYAMETLPTVLEHLEQVQMILAKLTGSGPQGLAASSPSEPVKTSAPDRGPARSTQ